MGGVDVGRDSARLGRPCMGTGRGSRSLDDPGDRQWLAVPSFFAARVIRALFFLAPVTAGGILFLWLTGASNVSRIAIWQVVIFHAGLVMVLPVATRVLRWLARRGAFGRVRLEGAWLKMGGRDDGIDLVRPFDADIRKTTARIKRSIQSRLRKYGGWRTHVQNVFVMAAALEQNGKRFMLYCDDGGGRKEPYDLSGLAVRPLPLLPPAGKVIRMRPCDLVEVIRTLQAAEGWSGNQAVGASGDHEGSGPTDPRAPFAKLARTILAVVLLAGASAGAIAAVYGHYAGIRQ